MTEITKEIIEELLETANKKQSAELKEYLDENIKDVNEKIRKTAEKLRKLEERCVLLERKQRKNNIVLFGIETSNENLSTVVLKKLNETLETSLEITDFNNVYKINRSPKSPVIVEFVSFYKKLVLFRDKSKLKELKNFGIAIANDLCTEDRLIQKVLVKHLKEARGKNIPARIRGFKLEIQGTLYTADQLEHIDPEPGTDIEDEGGFESMTSNDEHINVVAKANKKNGGSKRKKQTPSPKNIVYKIGQQKRAKKH